MIVLIKAAQFILSLSLLIVLHEFGHFMFAKIFKCRVEKFYLFFDPWFSLFKLKKGDTEYGLGWIPLGGYVKISGMIDESMDKEQMKQPVKPWEFRAKPSYQRLLIMVGGVLMNFIAALVIYIAVLNFWGEHYLPVENVKYGIEVNEVGEKIGFKDGDMVLAIDHQKVDDFDDVLPAILLDDVESVQVERDGKSIDVLISDDDRALMVKHQQIFGLRVPFNMVIGDFAKESPAKDAGLKKEDRVLAINGFNPEFHGQFSDSTKANAGEEVSITVEREGVIKDFQFELTDDGLLGVLNKNSYADYFETEKIEYGFFESIPAGIQRGIDISADYLKQFKLIFNKKTKGYEQLGGFITIGNIFPDKWDWHSFWNMTAFLSIILGIMNMLPIPALDGGHVMFVLYEMVTGRKPNEKFLEYAQMIGLILLLALVLYANFNDVMRLLG